MRALTWQGNVDVRVTDVPDPRIQEPNDAIIAVTSTAICGSDLHLYGVLGPYLSPGDVLGHEAMGVVTEVGADMPRTDTTSSGTRPTAASRSSFNPSLTSSAGGSRTGRKGGGHDRFCPFAHHDRNASR